MFKMSGYKKKPLKKLFSCEKYSVDITIHAALFSECTLWDKNAIPNAPGPQIQGIGWLKNDILF